MASLAEIEQALRKADAAGNTEDARMLAQAYQQAKPQQQSSISGRILQGMRDPIDASAQLLTHVLPESVVNAGNAANNWLADKTGLVGRLPEGGLDQSIAEQEKQYQAGRDQDAGIDWPRIGGNVLSPVNMAIGAKIPAAAGMGGRLATAAGAGAAYGATNAPVTEGEFWPEKGKQTAIGAAAGPAAEVIGAGAGRIISPKTRAEVKALMSEGVTPTPGQILGGRWQAAEDKLTSVPILGDAIAYSRSKGLDEFNRAAYKRALDPIGGTSGKDIGREGVSDVRAQLGKAYDNLLPQLTFKADAKFAADLKNLSNMTNALPPEQSSRFQKLLREQVVGKLGPQATIDGDTFKGIESELGRLASGLKSDAAFDNRQLGSAIGEVQTALRSNLERSNPQYAEELKGANKAWANYTRIRDAASRQGSADGKFTPAQLSAAVRAQDKTKGKRAFSEGTALMQDLSDTGKNVLGTKYPDSGSIGRLLMGLGVGGGAALLSPTTATLGAAATLPFLPGGRQLSAALLAKRPQGAEAMADTIRKLGPAATPALIQLLNQPAAQQ